MAVLPNRKIQSDQLAAFFIENDGGGQIVDVTLAEDSLTISKTNSAANGNLLVLSNSGTGYDIYGTGGVFKVDKNGNIFGNTLTVNTFTATNFNVSSTLQTNFLDVNFDVSVQRNLSVNQNLAVQGNFSVIGDTIFDEGEYNILTINDLLEVLDELHLFGTLTVSGGTIDLNSASLLNVSGQAVIAEEIVDIATINEATVTSLIVTSGLFVGANISSGIINTLRIEDHLTIDLPSNAGNFNIDAFQTGAALSGADPILFTVGSTSPYGLSFYNGLNTISLTASSLIEFDAVIPDDYPTPGAALTANVTRFFIRSGTYNDTGALSASQRTIIQGESRDSVIWKFDTLTLFADNNKISNLTIGTGADNSALTITSDYNILDNLLININASTVTEKINLTGNLNQIKNLEENDSECKTLLAINGNNNLLENIIGGSNTTDSPTDYQFIVSGNTNIIRNLAANSNNLLKIQGDSISCADLILNARFGNDAITIIDSSKISFETIDLIIAANGADAYAFRLNNVSEISIQNVKSNLPSLTSDDPIFIYLEDFSAGDLNLNISNISTNYYKNFIYIESISATINISGINITQIRNTNQVGHFFENTGGSFTLDNVIISDVKTSFNSNTTSFIKYYSGGTSSSLCENWKLSNCHSKLTTGVVTTKHLDFDFASNTLGTRNGINHLEISNCSFLNGNQVLYFAGRGSHINLTGVNFDAIGSNSYAFEFTANVDDILYLALTSLIIKTNGHCLKLSGSSNGDIKYVSLTGFAFNSTFTGGLTAGNGHFVLNAAGSSTVNFVVTSSGCVDTDATGGTIFNSSGTGANAHLHAIIWENANASLADSSWNVNDNNFGT